MLNKDSILLLGKTLEFSFVLRVERKPKLKCSFSNQIDLSAWLKMTILKFDSKLRDDALINKKIATSRNRNMPKSQEL